MIKAVFFDIDDTLFHFSEASKCAMKAVDAYVQETCNVGEEQLHQAIEQAQKKIGNRVGFDSGVFHNRQIRFQNALDILGIPIYPHANNMYKLYWDTVIDMAAAEPGVVEMLQALKKSGVYLGIGSDMTSYIQNKKLEKLGIAQYFDAVVTSEEAGRDKPAAELFELCIEKANCLPEECLFIGDRQDKDYKGAVAAGMHALCYARYSSVTEVKESDIIRSYENEMNRIIQMCERI